jgi:Flp pilus assembly protein CpaB
VRASGRRGAPGVKGAQVADTITADSRQERRRPDAGLLGRPHVPVASRVGRRRWKDTRTVVGLIVLLASVGLGARLLATGSDTSPVLAVSADLPAGHVLVAADLDVAKVRLDPSAASAYLAGDREQSVIGRVLSRGVTRGELLPAAAVDSQAAGPQRMVPVKVRDGRLPALQRGDRVDVFATVMTRASTPGAVASCAAVPVVTDAQVGQAVQQSESGSDVTLDLLVDPGEAGALILASEAGAVDVARHVAAGDDQGDVGSQPTTALGAGGSIASCGNHA